MLTGQQSCYSSSGVDSLFFELKARADASSTLLWNNSERPIGDGPFALGTVLSSRREVEGLWLAITGLFVSGTQCSAWAHEERTPVVTGKPGACTVVFLVEGLPLWCGTGSLVGAADPEKGIQWPAVSWVETLAYGVASVELCDSLSVSHGVVTKEEWISGRMSVLSRVDWHWECEVTAGGGQMDVRGKVPWAVEDPGSEATLVTRSVSPTWKGGRRAALGALSNC